MASLDTNVLLRWLLDDVPELSDRAGKIIGSGERLHVDDAAIIEVIFVLERVIEADRPTVRDVIGLLIATSNLVFDRQLWDAITPQYVARPKLSVVDIYLVTRAEMTGRAPLLTFDRKLASQVNGAELA